MLMPFTKQSRRRRGASKHSTVAVERMVGHVRNLAASLRDCGEGQLQAEAAGIAHEICGSTAAARPETLVAAAALATEAIRRAHSVELYDVQLLAILHLAGGDIAQMQTGEGKTLVAVATAAIAALSGRGVHVMTPNSYLAERDQSTAQRALQYLGLTVGLTAEQSTSDARRRAYDCDVTYGTGHEFGFDYLRDQLTLRGRSRAPLGHSIIESLRAPDVTARQTLQRGLFFAIVDEADSVMFDDAASPLVLSAAKDGTPEDLDAFRQADVFSECLCAGTDFVLHETTGQLQLTKQGVQRCYADVESVPREVLRRPWTAYVEQALRARYVFRRNVHYVVREDAVRIVDQTTGRIFSDRSWQDGLHQAIEVREGVTVTCEKEALARITRQRFFRLYDHLCGLTGTAVGCEQEFSRVYRCRVHDIPLHRPSARVVLPTRYFATREARLNAIVADVVRRNGVAQPVLIGTQSISDSEVLAEQLASAGVAFELLNGLQTREEAEIVAQAGQPSAVTIATNLAGRGTDIAVPPESQAVGGLHVVVAERQLSGRMDRQLIGRCARQGQPGSAQAFVSAEDELIVRFGDWVAQAIRREANDQGEAVLDLDRAVDVLQKKAERQEFLARAELLRRDLANDQLFGVDVESR